MTTNSVTGLSAIAREINNSFDIKTYTEEMLKYVQNPSAYPLSQVVTAFQFFQAMYNKTSFQVPGGPSIDFSQVDPSTAAQMHTLVVKALSDYGTVRVPYAPGKTVPLMITEVVNGKTVTKPASLLDLVSEPNGATFSIKYSGDPDQMIDSHTSPPWAPGFAGAFNNAFTAGQSLERVVSNVSDTFGIPGTGLSCHFHDGAWSFDSATFSISGSAQDWITAAAGSMVTSTSDSAAAQADAAALAQFIQTHI